MNTSGPSLRLYNITCTTRCSWRCFESLSLPVGHTLNHMATASFHTNAGQKHAAPQLRIKELMDPPEKSAVWPQKRRELRLVVLLRLECWPVCSIYTGSSYEGMKELPTYTKDNGEEYTTLSAAEYVDLVKPHLGKLKKTRDGPELKHAKYLLQDKCTAHTAKLAKEELSKHIQLLQLPTDSPDLTPCDTSFFAEVKGKWQRELARNPRPWAEACTLALEAVCKTKPDKYIKAMPLRWQACVNVEGWHIEQEYKLLKAAGKAG